MCYSWVSYLKGDDRYVWDMFRGGVGQGRGRLEKGKCLPFCVHGKRDIAPTHCQSLCGLGKGEVLMIRSQVSGEGKDVMWEGSFD